MSKKSDSFSKLSQSEIVGRSISSVAMTSLSSILGPSSSTSGITKSKVSRSKNSSSKEEEELRMKVYMDSFIQFEDKRLIRHESDQKPASL